MAIIASDITVTLSGGAAQSNPDLSLGGLISSVEVVDATIHNLFDLVSGQETTDGDTEYRCIYVKNTHATLTYQGSKVFINTQTPNADTSVEIALGTAAISAQEQSVVDESTAPTGVTWTALVGEGNALSIGDLTPGQFKAIWIKRIVNAASSAYNDDNVLIEFKGDTGA